MKKDKQNNNLATTTDEISLKSMFIFAAIVSLIVVILIPVAIGVVIFLDIHIVFRILAVVAECLYFTGVGYAISEIKHVD